MRRPSPSAALPLLGLAALAGCATAPRTFRCAHAGGPQWREIVSDHYILRTDLPDSEAGKLLGRVERLRAAIAIGLPGGAPPPAGRVDIIAFRTVEEYRPFSPDNALGYYIRYDGGSPRIVIPGEIGPWQHAMLAHELTHDFLAVKYRRRPRWFAEGLAVYMESVDESAGAHVVTVGAPRKERMEQARAAQVPVREILSWEGGLSLRRPVDYYASSWLLVHWLVHVRPEAFAELGKQLADGTTPELAWRAALPDIDPGDSKALDELDAKLASYAHAKLATQDREGDAPSVVAYFEQGLPPAEVHAVRLEIWQFGSHQDMAALRAEIRETLEEDPAHPIALEYLANVDRADPLPAARMAVAGHPNDPRAHTFLASALQGPTHAAEREASFRRAAELAPRNAAALHNLAEELLASGKRAEALPVAQSAAELAPWSPPVLAGYAVVLSALGRCSEAIRVQQRAIDAIPDRDTREERRTLARALATYAEKCRVARESPGP